MKDCREKPEAGGSVRNIRSEEQKTEKGKLVIIGKFAVREIL